ncbi:hypothetical protein [Marinobacter adhaerens]
MPADQYQLHGWANFLMVVIPYGSGFKTSGRMIGARVAGEKREANTW